MENFSIGGEPPAHIHFPVKFPYPRPSWASPAGKEAADLCLPLPSSRKRTPTPEPEPVRPRSRFLGYLWGI